MKRNVLIPFIVFFSGLCIFLFSSFYNEAKNNAILRLNETQTVHARQAANGIEEFFTTWTGILTLFAKMDAIISSDADGERHMDFFYELHRKEVRSITRMDENGIILYTAPHYDSIGSDISDQPHVREILQNHQPVVSDVFKAVQGFDAVALHVPVFKDDQFKGTIAIVINFETLTKRYLEVIRVGNTGDAWVVSRDGTTLYHPAPAFIGKSVFENRRDFPSIISMAQDMIQGHQGNATYTSDRMGGRIVAPVVKHAVYMPIRIGDTFWSIVVASAEDEVLASLASFRNRLLFVIGMILVGGVLFAVVGAKAWLIVAEEETRQHAEQELRASEQRYRHLFEQNPAPMLIYQRGTLRLLAVNEAFTRHYGYSREQALDLVLTDLYPEEEKGRIAELAAQLKGHAYVGEWHHRKADGSIITIVARSHDIDYWGYDARIAVISDISDIKRMEEALHRSQELDRLKSLFIASMSHELRTPLNSIIGFTGILLQGLAGPLNDEQRKQLGMVKGSSQHLLDLITDIIDLSKIEAGKISLSMEQFDLAKTAREVLESFRVTAGRKTISLIAEAPEHLLVQSDPRRVRQILVNLIGNAVKFTDEGGVTVLVTKENDRAMVSVCDTGPGIKKEDMGKLFQYFSQVTSADMPKHEGTGLGLYLSKKLLDLLGGEVTVESEFGKGSVFTVTLPLFGSNKEAS